MTKDIFLSGTNVGPRECFEYLNSMTDQSGNCGSSSSGYTKCKPKYALQIYLRNSICYI